MRILSISFIILLLSSCRSGVEKKTEAGFRYVLYQMNEGPKIRLGDYITLDLVYKTHDDSVLFDSRLHNVPLRFKLEKVPFKGSYEDGLRYLSEGDSATFFVPADSLYQHYYHKAGFNISQSLTAFEPATFLKFDVKVHKIQTSHEAEMEIALIESRLEKEEQQIMQKFLSEHKFSEVANGKKYYYSLINEGKGEKVKDQTLVSLLYKGSFLNGEVFDSIVDPEKPFKFIWGSGQVIKGWELALTDKRAGDKFKLLLPSSLAYGEEGLRNISNGKEIIPPFTPMLFEIEILSVENSAAIAR
ncbi:MAG: hypothetical protein DWQ44_07065 [Bacteroidetes bacterium]|nr:MAG: hypothetical protein DWQ33_12625 [Bacteroidota bacterium]REJ99776.1 MAG: hypothetical protein DWQ39_12685 [Bacteroidota bacterium]REK34149.1 MAG: hypothetical protein DWQ44_07065 [Bacteroidota bacterium]REK50479.1 MAG: hypothetical protein DWQ48_03975 [Bacteroidota bacterium]